MEAAVLWVVLAGLTEPLWIMSLKRYNASKNLLWGLPVLFFMVFDPVLLSWATDGGVPVSVAFSVWVSIGTVMASLTGYVVYKDPISRRKVMFIVMILMGVVGLQFVGGA
ncbi:MAG: SMR family transporter [archaeon]|nr:SMR family transporter [archaeon]